MIKRNRFIKFIRFKTCFDSPSAGSVQAAQRDSNSAKKYLTQSPGTSPGIEYEIFSTIKLDCKIPLNHLSC